MIVVRGRAPTIESDRAVSRRLLGWAAEGTPAVRAWRPHRQVAFGRRDVRSEGYDRAREAATARDFPPVERDVGGRAVAYTGRTVAFARATPANGRGGIDDRYERILGDLERALDELGVGAERGEPPDSFCPGTRSLQAGGKLAGVAQRVRTDAAVTAGIVVVDGHREIASVLDAVYDALAVPFDTDSVGSVARAGGDADPGRVARTTERALAGDDPEVVRAGDVQVERDDRRGRGTS